MSGSSDAPPATAQKSEFTVGWRDADRALVDYVAAVWSKRWWIAVATALTTCVAFLYALTKPNSYVSEATVLVTGTSISSNAADAATNLIENMRISNAQVQNALSVVRSRVVAQMVVERVGADVILRPYEPIRGRGGDDGGLVTRLMEGMHLLQTSWFAQSADEPMSDEGKRLAATAAVIHSFGVVGGEGSNTLRLWFRANNPEGAKIVLETAVDEAIKQYNHVMAPQASRKFLEDKLAGAEREERASRAAQQDFAKKNGSTDFGQEFSLLAKELAEYSGQIELAKVQLTEGEEVYDKLSKELETLSPLVILGESESDKPTSSLDKLIEEKVKLEIERARERMMVSQNTVEVPLKIQQLDKQIALYEQKINEGKAQAVDKLRTVSKGLNPAFADVQKKMSEKKLELIGLRVKVKELSKFVQNEGRARLETLRLLHDEAKKLHARVERAEKEFTKLQDTLKSFEVNDELQSRGVTSLRVIENANMPLDKEGPARGKLILAGLGGGVFAALTLILALTRYARSFLRGGHVRVALARTDVVAGPWLASDHVRRFRDYQRRGWE